jgi:hypothetical protein
MTMIRKQFFIDPDVSQRLKTVARQKGVSEADLIRSGIERVLAETSLGGDDWRAQFNAAMDKVEPELFEGFAERVAENRARRRQSRLERLSERPNRK